MRALSLPLAAALAACGPSNDDTGPGAVTVDEAKALDEAAEMIEQRRTPAEALTDEPDAAQQEPAPEEATPE
ncbi:MAG: hypothetical protein ACR2FJ_03160 [Qipengyuania sp.]